jgi:hypothetical protein
MKNRPAGITFRDRKIQKLSMESNNPKANLSKVDDVRMNDL